MEGEYIVGASVGSERSDELALLSLLKHMDARLNKRHKTITLDAGYESEENYKALLERGQTAYIKPQNYERSKTRKYRKNAYLRENMPYDPQRDSYICPQGNIFERLYETHRRSKSGFEAAVTVYECSGCDQCPQKALCTRAKGNRRLQVSKDFIALREASRERITSALGKTLRLILISNKNSDKISERFFRYARSRKKSMPATTSTDSDKAERKKMRTDSEEYFSNTP